MSDRRTVRIDRHPAGRPIAAEIAPARATRTWRRAAVGEARAPAHPVADLVTVARVAVVAATIVRAPVGQTKAHRSVGVWVAVRARRATIGGQARSATAQVRVRDERVCPGAYERSARRNPTPHRAQRIERRMHAARGVAARVARLAAIVGARHAIAADSALRARCVLARRWVSCEQRRRAPVERACESVVARAIEGHEDAAGARAHREHAIGGERILAERVVGHLDAMARHRIAGRHGARLIIGRRAGRRRPEPAYPTGALLDAVARVLVGAVFVARAGRHAGAHARVANLIVWARRRGVHTAVRGLVAARAHARGRIGAGIRSRHAHAVLATLLAIAERLVLTLRVDAARALAAIARSAVEGRDTGILACAAISARPACIAGIGRVVVERQPAARCERACGAESEEGERACEHGHLRKVRTKSKLRAARNP